MNVTNSIYSGHNPRIIHYFICVSKIGSSRLSILISEHKFLTLKKNCEIENSPYFADLTHSSCCTTAKSSRSNSQICILRYRVGKNPIWPNRIVHFVNRTDSKSVRLNWFTKQISFNVNIFNVNFALTFLCFQCLISSPSAPISSGDVVPFLPTTSPSLRSKDKVSCKSSKSGNQTG